MKTNYIPLNYQFGAKEDILVNYTNATMKVEDIAKKYNVTPRTIQRFVKQHGQIRTIAEANKITAKLKDYSSLRIPNELKVKRKTIPLKLRYQVLQAQKCCAVCRNVEKLQVDHIDNNPRNNKLENLQVLCCFCNKGKHLLSISK